MKDAQAVYRQERESAMIKAATILNTAFVQATRKSARHRVKKIYPVYLADHINAMFDFRGEEQLIKVRHKLTTFCDYFSVGKSGRFNKRLPMMDAKELQEHADRDEYFRLVRDYDLDSIYQFRLISEACTGYLTWCHWVSTAELSTGDGAHAVFKTILNALTEEFDAAWFMRGYPSDLYIHDFNEFSKGKAKGKYLITFADRLSTHIMSGERLTEFVKSYNNKFSRDKWIVFDCNNGREVKIEEFAPRK